MSCNPPLSMLNSSVPMTAELTGAVMTSADMLLSPMMCNLEKSVHDVLSAETSSMPLNVGGHPHTSALSTAGMTSASSQHITCTTQDDISAVSGTTVAHPFAVSCVNGVMTSMSVHSGIRLSSGVGALTKTVQQ